MHAPGDPVTYNLSELGGGVAVGRRAYQRK